MSAKIRPSSTRAPLRQCGQTRWRASPGNGPDSSGSWPELDEVDGVAMPATLDSTALPSDMDLGLYGPWSTTPARRRRRAVLRRRACARARTPAISWFSVSLAPAIVPAGILVRLRGRRQGGRCAWRGVVTMTVRKGVDQGGPGAVIPAGEADDLMGHERPPSLASRHAGLQIVLSRAGLGMRSPRPKLERSLQVS
jgi:hypothetical protein